ncbi:hypothetical protein PFISCL1PPCAC_8521, partial [Pristionchus fissidentatus]
KMLVLPLLLALVALGAARFTEEERREMAEILPAIHMLSDHNNILKMTKADHAAAESFMESFVHNDFKNLETDLVTLKDASEHVYSVLSPFFLYLKERYEALETSQAKEFVRNFTKIIKKDHENQDFEMSSIAREFGALSEPAKTDLYKHFGEIFAMIEHKERIIGRGSRMN